MADMVTEVYWKPGFGNRLREITRADALSRNLVRINNELFSSRTQDGYTGAPPVTAKPVNTRPPAISGDASVGSVLMLASGGWTGADTVTRQWLRDGNPIAAATGPSYTVTTTDEGTTISLRETATNSLGSTVVTSAGIAIPAHPVSTPPQNTQPPGIIGTPAVGQSLSVTPGTWTGNGISKSYEWLRDGVAIPSATGLAYQVVAADRGTTITVREIATNADGSANAVSQGVAVPAMAPPGVLTKPVITGNTGLGDTLTVTPGTWTGDDVQLSYQWFRDGSSIPGETGTTHEIVAEDQGKSLQVIETGSNAVDSSNNASANLPIPAAAVRPTNTAPPVIAGNTAEGDTLTVTPGTWTGDAPISVGYQWLRDGSPISGANAETYVLVADDLGTTISCNEIASNTAGTAGKISNEIAIPVPVAAPTNSALPTITGTAANMEVLTYVAGTWAGADNVARTFMRNGNPAPGGSADTYQISDSDAGTTITVRETATNAGGSAVANSAGIAIPAAPVKRTDPVLSGSPVYVGDIVTVTPATWDGTPTVTRQWTAGWVPIDGGTGLEHAVTMDESGVDLRVTETAVIAGFSVQALSEPLAVPPLIQKTAPTNANPPSVSDAGADSPILTAVAGSWNGAPVPTITRQWIRGGVDIAGETGATYTKQTGDTQIAVRETATNVVGSASATSAAVDPVFPAYMRMVAKTGGGTTGANGYAGSSLVPAAVYGATSWTIALLADGVSGLIMAFSLDGNFDGASFTLNGKTYNFNDALYTPSSDDGEGTVSAASYVWNGNLAGLVDGGTYDINWTFAVPVSAGSITTAAQMGSQVANSALGSITVSSGLGISNFFLPETGNIGIMLNSGTPDHYAVVAQPLALSVNGGLRHIFFPQSGGGPSLQSKCYMQGNVFNITPGTPFTYDLRPATLAMCVEIEIATGLDGSHTLTGFHKAMGIGKSFYANGGTPGLELLAWYHHGGADQYIIILNKDIGPSLMVYCNSLPSVFVKSADAGHVYTASPMMAQGMALPTKVGQRISMGCGAAQEPA